MKTVQKIEFHTGSKEELLPGFTDEFLILHPESNWINIRGVMCRGTGTGRWKSLYGER